jgi:hypothetical protein
MDEVPADGFAATAPVVARGSGRTGEADQIPGQQEVPGLGLLRSLRRRRAAVRQRRIAEDPVLDHGAELAHGVVDGELA